MTDLDALLAQADKHHVRPGDDECWECGSETWPCDYVLLAAAVRELRDERDALRDGLDVPDMHEYRALLAELAALRERHTTALATLIPTEEEVFHRIMRGAREPVPYATHATYMVIIRATLAAVRVLWRERAVLDEATRETP